MSSINRIHFEHFLYLIFVIIVIPVISVMKWIVCYFFWFYVIKWNVLVYWEYIYHYFFHMCIILVILAGLSIKEQYGPPCSVPTYRNLQSNGANWRSIKHRKIFLYNRALYNFFLFNVWYFASLIGNLIGNFYKLAH